MKTYFIGDLHLDHTNIIKYCNRPFRSTEEMNAHILKCWNEIVTNEDDVYFLGDIAFGRGSNSGKYWWEKLNGKKTLIKGNHDRYIVGIEPVHKYLIRSFNDIDFLLVHSPDYDHPPGVAG